MRQEGLEPGAAAVPASRWYGDLGHQALIRLYGLTSGWSNDLTHALITRIHPPRSLGDETSVLGVEASDAHRLAEQVRSHGFAVLPHLLGAELCDELTALAERAPTHVRLRPELPHVAYRDQPPDAPVVWLSEPDLAGDPVVQRLASDPGLLGLVQAYLSCEPVLSGLVMWWSRAVSSSESEQAENAQLFHFDMDRVKWIKVFVYLTDVTSQSGPHMLVEGSHRRGGQPRSLLRRGYVRHEEAEIRTLFGDCIKEVTGPRGTIFVADTRALHMGKPPTVGERLVLQLEFSDSLFGGQYNNLPRVEVRESQLRDASIRLPRTYKRWNLA